MKEKRKKKNQAERIMREMKKAERAWRCNEEAAWRMVEE